MGSRGAAPVPFRARTVPRSGAPQRPCAADAAPRLRRFILVVAVLLAVVCVASAAARDRRAETLEINARDGRAALAALLTLADLSSGWQHDKVSNTGSCPAAQATTPTSRSSSSPARPKPTSSIRGRVGEVGGGGLRAHADAPATSSAARGRSSPMPAPCCSGSRERATQRARSGRARGCRRSAPRERPPATRCRLASADRRAR